LGFKTRRKGALMLVSAPLLFILSGLFLANTVVHRPDSYPFLIGEGLCFFVAPALLIAGIIVSVTAPHVKKTKPLTIASRRETTPVVYSSTERTILLVRRIIGLAFIVTLFTLAFIADGTLRLMLAMFVAFPFPLFTIPYLTMALYLTLSKKLRVVDVFPIFGCAIVLWILLVPGTV